MGFNSGFKGLRLNVTIAWFYGANYPAARVSRMANCNLYRSFVSIIYIMYNQWNQNYAFCTSSSLVIGLCVCMACLTLQVCRLDSEGAVWCVMYRIIRMPLWRKYWGDTTQKLKLKLAHNCRLKDIFSNLYVCVNIVTVAFPFNVH